MTAVKHYRLNTLGTIAAGEIRNVLVGGSYVAYLGNNSGNAIPPAVLAHNHPISDITGLQTALDGKAAAFSTGNLVQGMGVTLSGTLTNRLVGSGNITISADLTGFATETWVTAGFAAKATTLAGYGIANAYTKTEVDNGFVSSTANTTDDWATMVSTSKARFVVSSINAPTGTGYMGVVIPNGAGTHGVALAFRNGAGYFRTTEAGVVGSWLKVATEAWVGTLGFATQSWVTGQNYLTSSALSGYVPTSRTLTINGTTLDLTANRSWTIPAGVSGSGTSGNLARWSSSAGLASSIIAESGNAITIGSTSGAKSLLFNHSTDGLKFFLAHAQADYTASSPAIFTASGFGASAPFNAQGKIVMMTNAVDNSGGEIAFYVGASRFNSLTLQYNGQIAAAGRIVSSVTTNSPFTVASTIVNLNLNADLLDGFHASAFAQTGDLAGYVPVGREITINGVTQNMTTNRSWTVTGSVGNFSDTWDGVIATSFKVNTSSSDAPTGAVHHGIWIPHSGSSNYGTMLAFRNGSGSFRSIENGSLTPWKEILTGITSGMVTTALGFTPVTNNREITINGVTQNLANNRSWTISAGSGTVTQVGLLVPTGFTVTSSPVTTSGNLQFAFASGYSLPTTASQNTWNAKVGGSGTANRIPLFTAGSTLGDSPIYHNGGNIGIGTSPSHKFQVAGNSYLGGDVFATGTISTSSNCAASTGFSTVSGGYYAGSGAMSSSALLQIDSTSKGVAIPRMTMTQFNAISGKIPGLMAMIVDPVNSSNILGLMFYTGSTTKYFQVI